jgi:hypothetical protein
MIRDTPDFRDHIADAADAISYQLIYLCRLCKADGYTDIIADMFRSILLAADPQGRAAIEHWQSRPVTYHMPL